MRSPIIAGALALACALGPIAETALAQPAHRPPPPGQQGYRHPAPPPKGWDRRQWEYRQRYERTHPRRRRDDHSDAVVAGLFGFILGAALAESRDEARPRLEDRRWIAACARKYRSFDPDSGTYLGRDGLRHYCRL